MTATLSLREFLGVEVPIEENIRDRVIFLAGKAVGVDCPNCDYRGRDVDLDALSLTNTSCPACETTILTEEQKSELWQAGKL